MTVAELIAALQKLPPDAVVVSRAAMEAMDTSVASGVAVFKVKLSGEDVFDEWWPGQRGGPTDPPDGFVDAVEVS